MKCYFIQDSIVIKVRRNPTLKFVICHAHVCTVHSCTHPTEKQCCKHLIQKEVNGDVGQGQGVKTYIKKDVSNPLGRYTCFINWDHHYSKIPQLYSDSQNLVNLYIIWVVGPFRTSKAAAWFFKKKKWVEILLKKLQMNSIGVMKFSRSHRFKTWFNSICSASKTHFSCSTNCDEAPIHT